jgi:hypothetical protein
MAKRLSEQLADLSVQAKSAEEAVTSAEKEAHDKVVARKEQARAAASAAAEKVNQKINSAKDATAQNWNAVKAKVAADLDGLKASVAQKKHELGAKRARDRCTAGRPQLPSDEPHPRRLLTRFVGWFSKPLGAVLRRPSSSPQDPETSESGNQQRHTEAEPLPVAGLAPEVAEDQLVPRRDLASSGEILPKPLGRLRLHGYLAPAHVLLERLEARELGASAVDRLQRFVSRQALTGA